jgi:hypothetical protein
MKLFSGFVRHNIVISDNNNGHSPLLGIKSILGYKNEIKNEIKVYNICINIEFIIKLRRYFIVPHAFSNLIASGIQEINANNIFIKEVVINTEVIILHN